MYRSASALPGFMFDRIDEFLALKPAHGDRVRFIREYYKNTNYLLPPFGLGAGSLPPSALREIAATLRSKRLWSEDDELALDNWINEHELRDGRRQTERSAAPQYVTETSAMQFVEAELASRDMSATDLKNLEAFAAFAKATIYEERSAGNHEQALRAGLYLLRLLLSRKYNMFQPARSLGWHNCLYIVGIMLEWTAYQANRRQMHNLAHGVLSRVEKDTKDVRAISRRITAESRFGNPRLAFDVLNLVVSKSQSSAFIGYPIIGTGTFNNAASLAIEIGVPMTQKSDDLLGLTPLEAFRKDVRLGEGENGNNFDLEGVVLTLAELANCCRLSNNYEAGHKVVNEIEERIGHSITISVPATIKYRKVKRHLLIDDRLASGGTIGDDDRADVTNIQAIAIRHGMKHAVQSLVAAIRV